MLLNHERHEAHENKAEEIAGPLGCSFAGREDLEELLLDGLASGRSVPMTPARKQQIYKEALEEA
jgi:hypothetical protein